MPFVKRPNTKTADAALDRLRIVGDEYQRQAAELERVVAKRDAAIVKASAAGATRRAVADAAGITVGRVQQIVDRATQT